MAERDAGKAHRDLRIADAADQEAGAAGIVVGARHADLVGQRRDFVEEGRQFDRLRAIVERRHKFDRFADVRKIGSKLLLPTSVEHGESYCKAGEEETGARRTGIESAAWREKGGEYV